jgi:hypothetical protein
MVEHINTMLCQVKADVVPFEGLFALEWIEGDWMGLNPLLYKFV